MDINQPGKFYPGIWRLPRDPGRCCIYRVPKCIRDVNPEAYTPQLVLIGPLHHSLKSQARKSLDLGDDITYTKSMGYLNMEEQKKNYLSKFAEKDGREKIIDELRRTIEENEEDIRASYSESTDWIQSQEFAEMVLHDSIFILVFIVNFTVSNASVLSHAQEKVGDPLMDELCVQNAVYNDLMLLENQLPYFILKKLFDLFVTNLEIDDQPSFWEIITFFFRFPGKIGNNSTFRHFTDIFRCGYMETLPEQDEGNYKAIQHMHNADKLDSGGVKFKAIGEGSLLNVTFENGCLKMPCLRVDDKFEMMIRNIIALEQCHYISSPHVCNYIIFLDYLIDSEKDVDLLVEKGIIKNGLGEPALVARMVNKLTVGIVALDSYYYDIAVRCNAYYSNPVKRSQAILKRVYFGNLWTGTATIAATFLLVMTLIQTVASIIQVMQNASK